MAKTSLDLLHGTVAVLILKTLTWGPLHGYDISRTIRQRSDGALGLEDAALYQAKREGRNRACVAPSEPAAPIHSRFLFVDVAALRAKQLRRGARIRFDETRVNDEVWLPRHISVAASARLGIFKKLRVQEDTTYKNFRKFQTDSRLLAGEQPQ